MPFIVLDYDEYRLYENIDDSRDLALEIYNSLNTDDPIKRINMWNNLDLELKMKFKKALLRDHEQKLIKPAIDGWRHEQMHFIVKNIHNQIGPHTSYRIHTDGYFDFNDIEVDNPEIGFLYDGEFISNKYAYLFNL